MRIKATNVKTGEVDDLLVDYARSVHTRVTRKSVPEIVFSCHNGYEMNVYRASCQRDLLAVINSLKNLITHHLYVVDEMGKLINEKGESETAEIIHQSGPTWYM